PRIVPGIGAHRDEREGELFVVEAAVDAAGVAHREEGAGVVRDALDAAELDERRRRELGDPLARAELRGLVGAALAEDRLDEARRTLELLERVLGGGILPLGLDGSDERPRPGE